MQSRAVEMVISTASFRLVHVLLEMSYRMIR